MILMIPKTFVILLKYINHKKNEKESRVSMFNQIKVTSNNHAIRRMVIKKKVMELAYNLTIWYKKIKKNNKIGFDFVENRDDLCY